MIFVELETPEPIPAGGEVRGYAEWQPELKEQGRACEVSLRWATEGRGDTDEGVVAHVSFPLNPGVPQEPTRFPFRFQLPADGPVSYYGSLLTVYWEVRARIDVSWAIDPRARRRFTVVPRLL